MRKPASPTRFLTVACYGVWMVRTGMGALVVLHSLGSMLLRNRHMSGPPDWIFALAGALSALTVVVVWVQYRRGELDEYDHRRRRAGRRRLAM